MVTNIRVLELFSGIGGMHFALSESRLSYEVVLAVDINDLANKVYKHNFPVHNASNKNIKGLTVDFINRLNANAILMSPPCQPFTRNGKFLDVEDHRTDPFHVICELIPNLSTIEYILMENVLGFDKSKARGIYLDVLKKSGYHFQEFVLSPKDLGVPNTRHRYYCIARKVVDFPFKTEAILHHFPYQLTVPKLVRHIREFLEPEDDHLDFYMLSDNILNTRYKVLDVCSPSSTNSMCFTKAYTRYLEGTGSVLSSLEPDLVKECFNPLLYTEQSTELDPAKLLKPLQLRFFTPKEVARLMSFPESFSFPPDVTNKQRYRLLGNSINVAVVAELIKLLFCINV